MTKIIMATIFFVSQVFGQGYLQPEDPVNNTTKYRITYLEADLKFNKKLLEYELRKLALYQEYMDKGIEPVYVESLNKIAISYAISLLTLSGVIKFLENIDAKKMTSDQLAKHKEWYKKNQMGSVKVSLVLIFGSLMAIPVMGLLSDEHKNSYMRKLTLMSGEGLLNEQILILDAITKYSEAIQSAQTQLDKLK